ncbi:hypothetical protein HanXRQr2_Chr17g0823141 [Helianthus annuus]|uniref:Uncharacterized protein n=1 Tax=Helianthus annuus TaxID=4232 RepID=A0A9K3DKR8_HELAN|nr:hypothetical protein HanXRQr2_Chr17g0823141 [Helianthus annuus]
MVLTAKVGHSISLPLYYHQSHLKFPELMGQQQHLHRGEARQLEYLKGHV